MKTRLEEVEELLKNHKLIDWIGENCDWDGGIDDDGYAWGMKAWEEKLEDYVRLRIEKHDLLKK